MDYKDKAKIFVKDEKFILEKGSIIKRPTTSYKEPSFYKRNTKLIEDYIDNGKVKETDGELVIQVNIEYKSASAPADFISGKSQNGWEFFEYLKDLRDNK